MWVHDAARIQLSPVGVSAARRFLTGRADDEGRWRPVLDKLRRPGSHPLARALSTPWRLTLAAAVYDQRDPATGRYARDPADLIDPGLDTEDKIRDHLLSLFIPAAVAAHGSRYPVARIRQWLGVLARYLDANTPAPGRSARVVDGRTLSGTDLVLHELWPLAGPRTPRVLTVAVAAALWVGDAVWLLIHMPTGDAPLQVLRLTGPALVAILVLIVSWEAWIPTFLFDFQRLKDRSGRRHLGIGLAIGLVAGLVFGLMSGLVVGLWAGLSGELTSNPGRFSVAEPRQIVKANGSGKTPDASPPSC